MAYSFSMGLFEGRKRKQTEVANEQIASRITRTRNGLPIRNPIIGLYTSKIMTTISATARAIVKCGNIIFKIRIWSTLLLRLTIHHDNKIAQIAVFAGHAVKSVVKSHGSRTTAIQIVGYLAAEILEDLCQIRN